MLNDTVIDCPYCGEPYGTLIDASGAIGDDSLQVDYIEDCAVCCCPIRIVAQFAPDGSLLEVEAKRDEDI